ncbi:hypothetical protein [Desulfonema magnum]|uniref:Uncharacterized protein n=1 Tax=Desulfonema magnum TaxID=45655 RepID=A0A975BVX7_9BACT|nr:hypothetical protein [Desulfonema magnum]QTA92736.1 Uncharacterized protein dnm_088250 [Desulfonema magnum]
MYLQKERLQHISSVAYEDKVVVFSTDAHGKIFYTVKQDGFEKRNVSEWKEIEN